MTDDRWPRTRSGLSSGPPPRVAGTVRAPRSRGEVAAVVVALLATVVWGVWALADPPAGGPRTAPPAGVDASPVPLSVPPVRQAPAGSYAFIEVRADGSPVVWDPCRPIRYVVNPEGEPVNGRALIDIALASVSRETGLRFDYVGTTDERPSLARRAYQPDRYGDRWAPVLVGWSDAVESPDLAGTTLAFAVPERAGSGQERAIVTGQVVLDRTKLARMLHGGQMPTMALAVVMHELGHLVGLDHVLDEGQLMHPYSRDTLTRWGPGDLAGLSAAGRGPCVPSL